MRDNYFDFISRNSVYINNDLQKKIKEKTIFFAGCGLGSVIAESAIRTGFSRFKLIDGDNVDSSNLNRQYYFRKNIGKNKAQSLKDNLKMINPSISIKHFTYFINDENIDKLIEDVDFLINTVDLNDTYFQIIKKAISKDIPVLCPFNVGFGGIVLIFNKKSYRPNQIWGVSKIKSSNDFYLKLLRSLKNYKIPKYLHSKIADIFALADKEGYYPQLSIGASIVSSITLTAIIKIINREKVILAPKPLHIDSYSLK